MNLKLLKAKQLKQAADWIQNWIQKNSQQTNEVNSIRQANINLKVAKATLGTVN